MLFSSEKNKSDSLNISLMFHIKILEPWDAASILCELWSDWLLKFSAWQNKKKFKKEKQSGEGTKAKKGISFVVR